MERTAEWIKPSEGEVKNARLFLTGPGTYEAVLNDRRAGGRKDHDHQKSRFVPKGTYIFYAPRKETL